MFFKDPLLQLSLVKKGILNSLNKRYQENLKTYFKR